MNDKIDYQIPVLCRNCPQFHRKWEDVKELCMKCNGPKERRIIGSGPKKEKKNLKGRSLIVGRHSN